MESQDSISREKVANKIIALESKNSSLAEETKYLKERIVELERELDSQKSETKEGRYQIAE